MFQLVAVVCAIALSAIVVAGGVNYVSSDTGTRTIVYEKATYAGSIVGQALLSYRRANGVDPRVPSNASDDAWKDELAPYLPGKVLPEVLQMEWEYLRHEGRRRLCLHTGGVNVSEAAHTAFVQAATPQTSSFVAKTCDASGPDAGYDGRIAVVFLN